MRNRRTSFWLGLILLVAISLPGAAFSAPYAYVADRADDLVTIIDLATDSVVSKVDLGFNAGSRDLILHPTRPHLYVSNYSEGTVSVVDVGTPGSEIEITQISVGLNPEGLAFSPDGKKLYVAHGDDTEFTGVWAQYLTEINVDDTASDYHQISRVRKFAQNDASAPYSMEVVEIDGRLKAFISGRLAEKVYVVDIENLYYVYNDPTPADPTDNPQDPPFLREINLTAGSDPHGLAVSSSGFVYVACQGLDQLAIIDTTKTPLADIKYQDVGLNPTDVALHPGGGLVYVANTGDATVSTIDISASVYSEFLPAIPVGFSAASAPQYLAVATNGERLYVSGKDDDSLTIVETLNHTVLSTILLADAQAGEEIWGSQGVIVGEDVPVLSVLTEKNFGEVILGSSAAETFTVTNKGTAPLIITNISGLTKDSYSIDTGNCINNDLAYNATCSFTVTFAPTSVSDPLPISDSFVISSNADNDPAQLITLAGIGTPQTSVYIPKTPATTAGGAVVTGNNVTFSWENKDSRTNLTYRVDVSTDNLFSDYTTHYFDHTGASTTLAGVGLVSLLLLGGAMRTRNRRMLLIASLFAVTLILTACGGGGGGGTPAPTNTITSDSTILSSGTYYWRAAAIDSGGGVSSFSTTRSFVIE